MLENECEKDIDFYEECWNLIIYVKALSLPSPLLLEIC